MNANRHALWALSTMTASACALGGCQWFGGTENPTIAADGGQTSGDALGPMDGDAAVPAGCPEPCVADAVADFAYVQGGATGTWAYVAEAPGAVGLEYEDMLLANQGGTQVWVSRESLPATIVHCPSSPAHPDCTGVEDKILLGTTDSARSDPALVWYAPLSSPGVYRVSGDWRIPPGAIADEPMTLLLVRNSRFDRVVEERFLTSALPAAFDIEVDMLPGDALRLIAIAGDDAQPPLAVSFYVSEARGATRCQVATQFATTGDGAPISFSDACNELVFEDQHQTTSSCAAPDPTCPATTELLPPSPIRGRARAFVEGASVSYRGSPNDYSGDFTVQFWADLPSPRSANTETLLADHDCATERGIRVHHTAVDDEFSEMTFEVYFEDPAFDRCIIGPTKVSTLVTHDQLNFVRLTRSTATGTMSVCINGEHRGDAPVPGDVDISATHSLWLGRAVTGEPARFNGVLADLRVFDVALPCSGP